jgi:hypothetical protein
MKGYVYLDLDGDLNYKTWEYINDDNPGFFSTNRHLILKSWLFDTENKVLFNNMLQGFTDTGIKQPTIMNLFRILGIGLKAPGSVNAS